MARAGGHRRGLEDDGVTTGRQPNCHLLIEDPTGSLEEERGRGIIIIIIINCLSFSYGPHETTRIHGLCVMKPLDLLSSLFLTMICFQDVHGVIDDRGGEIVSKNGC